MVCLDKIESKQWTALEIRLDSLTMGETWWTNLMIEFLTMMMEGAESLRTPSLGSITKVSLRRWEWTQGTICMTWGLMRSGPKRWTLSKWLALIIFSTKISKSGWERVEGHRWCRTIMMISLTFSISLGLKELTKGDSEPASSLIVVHKTQEDSKEEVWQQSPLLVSLLGLTGVI